MTTNAPDQTNSRPSGAMGRARALAKLGLVAAALYAAPSLVQLDVAQAQSNAGGGGMFGGMFGGGGGGSGAIEVATDPTTVKECGSCHDPYAPRYLPDGSWRQMMGNLSNHFGEDASLDPQTAQKITSYLVNNAGGRGTGSLRITETRWFVGAHRGEARLGGRAKTWSECSACHFVPGTKRK